MADHQTMRARVRLYLDAGVSYNQAIYRANHDRQTEAVKASVLLGIGDRPQLDKPEHDVREAAIRCVGGGWRG